MIDPRRLRGAFARLAFASALALAIVFAIAGPRLAHAAGRGGQGPAPVEFASPSAPVADVIAEAARWIGSGKMTGLPGPWCADFVSFVLRRTGHAPLDGRMAADALHYGPHVAAPRPGDLAVIRTRRGWAGHVGLVEGIEPDGSIRLISGNWGHRVARSAIPRFLVVAFIGVK
jgi:uncharacterized protein (TIGR02594 family)